MKSKSSGNMQDSKLNIAKAEGGDASHSAPASKRVEAESCCIRDIDVPHSAGAKGESRRGAIGVDRGRRTGGKGGRERSIPLVRLFRFSARMDRRDDAGRVVVCRRRKSSGGD